MDLQEIVASLRAVGRRNRHSAVKGNILFSLRTLHTGHGPQSTSYSNGTEFYFLGVKKDMSVTLTTYMHLVPKLRMGGSTPPLFLSS